MILAMIKPCHATTERMRRGQFFRSILSLQFANETKTGFRAVGVALLVERSLPNRDSQFESSHWQFANETMTGFRAMGVALLVQRSLPKLEIHSSNQFIVKCK